MRKIGTEGTVTEGDKSEKRKNDKEKSEWHLSTFGKRGGEHTNGMATGTTRVFWRSGGQAGDVRRVRDTGGIKKTHKKIAHVSAKYMGRGFRRLNITSIYYNNISAAKSQIKQGK
jgi:hypothetical protein